MVDPSTQVPTARHAENLIATPPKTFNSARRKSRLCTGKRFFSVMSPAVQMVHRWVYVSLPILVYKYSTESLTKPDYTGHFFNSYALWNKCAVSQLVCTSVTVALFRFFYFAAVRPVVFVPWMFVLPWAPGSENALPGLAGNFLAQFPHGSTSVEAVGRTIVLRTIFLQTQTVPRCLVLLPRFFLICADYLFNRLLSGYRPYAYTQSSACMLSVRLSACRRMYSTHLTLLLEWFLSRICLSYLLYVYP